jgi:hypothetical protein
MLCPICGYENPQEEMEICPQCGFDLKNGMNLYDKPIEGIKKASEILKASKEISPEDANKIYNDIVADSGKVIAVAKNNFEQSLNEVMARFQMDAQYDPATAEEYIKPYNDMFMQAAETVNKGLESIGNALTSSNPTNLQEIQMQLDLGTTLIEQGFFAMQNLGISMGVTDDGEYPIDIEEVSQMLDYVSAYLGSYLNTKNIQELKAGFHYLKMASEHLEAQINEYDEMENRPPTDLKEELSYNDEEEYEEEEEEIDDEVEENEEEEEISETSQEEASGNAQEEIPQTPEQVHESIDSFESNAQAQQEETENNNSEEEN